MSDSVKEIIFMIQPLGSMKISVKLSVMVRVENVGAMFIASKISTKSHTKHMDNRYKFVNEYVEDGVVKIIFLKFAENDNILTNNLSAELQEKHSKTMICENLEKFPALKIFEVKREGVSNVVLTSNI